MSYLGVFFVFIVSGFLWFVSAETYAIAAGVTQDPRYHGMILAMTLAASQTFGYCVGYFCGQTLMKWSDKLCEKVQNLDTEKFEKATAATLMCGAITGVPPLAALAIVAGTLKTRLSVFVTMVFVGRAFRFAILYYFGQRIWSALGWRAPEALPF